MRRGMRPVTCDTTPPTRPQSRAAAQSRAVGRGWRRAPVQSECRDSSQRTAPEHRGALSRARSQSPLALPRRGGTQALAADHSKTQQSGSDQGPHGSGGTDAHTGPVPGSLSQLGASTRPHSGAQPAAACSGAAASSSRSRPPRGMCVHTRAKARARERWSPARAEEPRRLAGLGLGPGFWALLSGNSPLGSAPGVPPGHTVLVSGCQPLRAPNVPRAKTRVTVLVPAPRGATSDLCPPARLRDSGEDTCRPTWKRVLLAFRAFLLIPLPPPSLAHPATSAALIPAIHHAFPFLFPPPFVVPFLHCPFASAGCCTVYGRS